MTGSDDALHSLCVVALSLLLSFLPLRRLLLLSPPPDILLLLLMDSPPHLLQTLRGLNPLRAADVRPVQTLQTNKRTPACECVATAERL